jgi:hypothetical protein
MVKKTSPYSKKLHKAASVTLASAKTIAQNVAGLLPASQRRVVGGCAVDHAWGVGGESGVG